MIDNSVQNDSNIHLEYFYGKENENAHRWINQTEVLLKYQHQLDKRKWTNIAFSHLRENAMSWLIKLLENSKKETIPWNEFKEMFIQEFGKKQNILTWFTQLTSYKQDYYSEKYIELFNNSINQCTIELSDEMILCLFYNGLDSESRKEVLLRSPSSLKDAIAIVRTLSVIRKEENKRKNSTSFKKSFIDGNKKISPISNNSSKDFTKYQKPLKVKEQQIHLIENDDDYSSIKEEISLYPYYSLNNFSCLIDSGATINLINQNICTNLLKTKLTQPIIATLADGTKIKITEFIKNLKFKTQNKEFIDNFYIFPLKKYDCILCKNWLEKNDAIIYWKEKKIKFNDNTKTKLKQNLKQNQFLYLVEFNQTKKKNDNVDEELQQLLEKYSDVFPEKLTELPPERKQDHKIETGSNQPIARQPYTVLAISCRPRSKLNF